MAEHDNAALKQRISEVTGRAAQTRIEVFEDTSEFIGIEAGSVLRLAGNDYLVAGNAREGRFGIDEQPKFWVKSAIVLKTGVRKFIKLVFHESFKSRIGSGKKHSRWRRFTASRSDVAWIRPLIASSPAGIRMANKMVIKTSGMDKLDTHAEKRNDGYVSRTHSTSSELLI